VNHVSFAPETRGDFAQQLLLFLPPRFQCPREDLLKMIAVVHGGVKENNISALFGSREFVLQGWMTIRRKLIRLCHGFRLRQNYDVTSRREVVGRLDARQRQIDAGEAKFSECSIFGFDIGWEFPPSYSHAGEENESEIETKPGRDGCRAV
jgi:hypothetical protein